MADAAVVAQIDPLTGADGGQLQSAETGQFVAMVHQLFEQDVHDVRDGVLGLGCSGGHCVQPSQARFIQGTYPDELPKLRHMPALAAGSVVAFELVGVQYAPESGGLGDVLPDPLGYVGQQREVAQALEELEMNQYRQLRTRLGGQLLGECNLSGGRGIDLLQFLGGGIRLQSRVGGLVKGSHWIRRV